MTDAIVWQKSSFSGGGDGPNCLELGSMRGSILLRESESPSQFLDVEPRVLTGLLNSLKGRSGNQ
ncbi:DUF397 domain-containing protein [Streptomyces iconiensis]|uniref:DUF397 domain-containing protein n=2 Tax=Streptomyces iconiensis TaxID=1384038 RepID=A0ABT7A444_9ACTN|nr:DUF397 domain-containing protein [Streptomyces iconiensis]MDJ1136071.1 DUF397 domain-containing protein [Streptomyces iconiensis]